MGTQHGPESYRDVTMNRVNCKCKLPLDTETFQCVHHCTFPCYCCCRPHAADTRLQSLMLRMLLQQTPHNTTARVSIASCRLMRSRAGSTQTSAQSFSSTTATLWQPSPPGRPRIIIITGPTAVGKTKLSLELAKRLDGEIISADSVQVYKGLDIGSDKVWTPTDIQHITARLYHSRMAHSDVPAVASRAAGGHSTPSDRHPATRC